MKLPPTVGSRWQEVARRLAAAPAVALFTDFDGTLAPISRRHHAVPLPVAARRALQRLRRLPRVRVGVVSGRALADLRRRVGIRGIHYVGSHGLEWQSPDERRGVQANATLRARIQAEGEALARRLASLPGIYVEQKPASVAVHYRNASPRSAEQARQAVGRALRRNGKRLRLLSGKKVWELLPAGDVDKGEAVLRLARVPNTSSRRWPLIIYLGDDTTDESVFRRLRSSDLGIHVGNGPTRAHYRLRSPADVARFLNRLPEVLR